MSKLKISSDGRTITVRVPISIRRRGGRKVVLFPNGTDRSINRLHSQQRAINAIGKAIARAYRWRALLESGAHSTIAELAEAEKINTAYVSRVLRLTCAFRRSRPLVPTHRDHLFRTIATSMARGMRAPSGASADFSVLV